MKWFRFWIIFFVLKNLNSLYRIRSWLLFQWFLSLFPHYSNPLLEDELASLQFSILRFLFLVFLYLISFIFFSSSSSSKYWLIKFSRIHQIFRKECLLFQIKKRNEILRLSKTPTVRIDLISLPVKMHQFLIFLLML